MRKFIDLSEKKFGRLTPIKRVKKPENVKKGTFWLCKCDCGKEISVETYSITSGHTLSCGCFNREKTSKRFLKDLTGQKFGKLTADYQIGRTKDGNVIWHCFCECGNETNIKAGNLKSGATQSCGCYRREKLSNIYIRNLIGKRFGKLVVNYDTGKRQNEKVIWRCICDCGNEVDVISQSLLGRDTQSCGCLSDSFIAYSLKKYFITNYNAKIEYKILKNPNTKKWLPYDIYISSGINPKINGIYIEVNGYQHYELNRWHKRQAEKSGNTPEQEFQYQKYKDELKKKFAKKNGIYIEVDLRKIDTLEMGIKYIKKYTN